MPVTSLRIIGSFNIGHNYAISWKPTCSSNLLLRLSLPSVFYFFNSVHTEVKVNVTLELSNELSRILWKCLWGVYEFWPRQQMDMLPNIFRCAQSCHWSSCALGSKVTHSAGPWQMSEVPESHGWTSTAKVTGKQPMMSLLIFSSAGERPRGDNRKN
jgi:hypothetical protein